MRTIQTITIVDAIAAATTSFALLSVPQIAAQPILPVSPGELRPATSFAAIADPRARAVALFQEAGKVLQHPRCVNCHPRGDSPHQTDRMRQHQPLVVRGTDGHGAATLPCNTCHGLANFDPAHVPGHPEWHLAPVFMAWEGRSLGQICEQIKDRERNGGRTMTDLLHHLSEDTLVGWAWTPGSGRTPAPGTQCLQLGQEPTFARPLSGASTLRLCRLNQSAGQYAPASAQARMISPKTACDVQWLSLPRRRRA